MIQWLEAHDKLAGWAQFFGAILALGVTYFTAFAPSWSRQKQLQITGSRLLFNCVEVLQSYENTLSHFKPFPTSIRLASHTMEAVVADIGRFPTHELSDQGQNSLARRLTAQSMKLGGMRLFMEQMARDIEGQEPTQGQVDDLMLLIKQQRVEAERAAAGLAPTPVDWSPA